MKIIATLGVIVIIGATGWIFHAGRNAALENLAGIAALAAAMGPWDGPFIRLAARFGKHAYGIYLAHLLFLELFFAILAAQASRIPGPCALEFAAALGFSYALVWLLSQWRGTRWLTGD